MKRPTSDIFMAFSNILVELVEGKSDGLVTPDGARWTNFMGVHTGTTARGISHCDEVDLRRRPFTRKSPASSEQVSDIVELYRQVAMRLEGMGF